MTNIRHISESEKELDDYMNDIKRIPMTVIELPYKDIPKKIPYLIPIRSDEETIDVLSNRIGRLENKAIRKLIEDLELGTIMSRYLSMKDMDIYYRSREKLSTLLQQIVSEL